MCKEVSSSRKYKEMCRKRKTKSISLVTWIFWSRARKKTGLRKVIEGGFAAASPSVTADIFSEKCLDSARVRLARRCRLSYWLCHNLSPYRPSVRRSQPLRRYALNFILHVVFPYTTHTHNPRTHVSGGTSDLTPHTPTHDGKARVQFPWNTRERGEKKKNSLISVVDFLGFAKGSNNLHVTAFLHAIHISLKTLIIF